MKPDQNTRWADQKRRQRRTEGSYAYNESHGLEWAGVMKRFRQRRWLRGLADVSDEIKLKELFEHTRSPMRLGVRQAAAGDSGASSPGAPGGL